MLALCLLPLGACDFSVTNPGPVQDRFLDEPEAQTALVNGMGRTLVEAVNLVAYVGGVVSREIHFAGQTGAHGVSFQQHLGRLRDDETGGEWNNAQQARWVAEDGVRRLREALGGEFASEAGAAQALVWVGYSNRLLGENMCEAVIDGGTAQPERVYLERAEQAFTEALAIARAAGDADLANAAIAGRASVRLDLGDWTGALEDAARVPEAFRYQLRTSDLDQNQHNRLYWAVANQPYRAYTVWNTYYDQYYLDYRDPRTSWTADPDVPYGNAGVQGIGQVPWHYQTKYTSRNSPYNLSTGREMRLIEAEAKLRDGDWQGAMSMVNALRSSLGVAPWAANNVTEAWTALKRERGIELWLEGRRLNDLRRWIAANTPGEQEDMTERDLCFPIPLSERETNPNIPST